MDNGVTVIQNNNRVSCFILKCIFLLHLNQQTFASVHYLQYFALLLALSLLVEYDQTYHIALKEEDTLFYVSDLQTAYR